MSANDAPGANPAIRGLLDAWAATLIQVFESMADERPDLEWMPDGQGAESQDPDFLWWEQTFRGLANARIWVGTPRAAWEDAGGRTLRAAGLEEVNPAEARNTWLEILSQSLSGLARAAGSIAGHEVTCASGSETAPPSGAEFSHARLSFGGTPLAALSVALSPGFLESASSAAGHAPESEPQEPAHEPGPAGPRRPRTMDVLLDVELPVSISFGKKQIPMKDVLKLTTGSIIELDRDVNDPVEVLVNHCLIARGEVVVVEGNYGVRIQEIASRNERLRSVR